MRILIRMSERKSFPSISPAAYEHPADRAALSAFKALPGASELVKRLVGSTAERSFRLSFLGGAARVSSGQFPRIYGLVQEAARVLDVSPVPEAFVRLSPEPEASTFGVQEPFILLSSAALDLWNEEELLSVVGHEMGHVLSGHTVYKTLFDLIVKLSATLGGSSLIGAATLATLRSALAEWNRKSELTADRAGLLVAQEPTAVYRALMKSAAGPRIGEMDLNEFFRQARDYDASAQGLDSLLKFLDIVADTHPLSSVRMVALQEWEKSGAYESILGGQYQRRGESSSERDPDLAQRIKEARDSYAQDFSSSQDPLSQAAGKVMDALGGMFGQAKRPVDERDAGGPDDSPESGPKSVEEFFDDIFGKKRPL
jgi:Zn-dependent protease with chaperone function